MNRPVFPLRALAASFAFFLFACGGIRPGGGLQNADSGEVFLEECAVDFDCPVGRQCRDTRCVVPVVDDAGQAMVCTRDEDCGPGAQCLKSTGECVKVEVAPDAGAADAGVRPACSPDLVTSCGVSKLGACQLGTTTCVEDAGTWGWGPCIGAVNPKHERCDGLDNDCDGLIDEGFPSVTCGSGACIQTIATCSGGVPQTCVPKSPTAESCDGQDNDCDGQVDEGLGNTSCGTGACARSVTACVNGAAQACVAGTPVAESCNSVDDDCDGQVDEAFGTLACGSGACARSVAACVNGASMACVPGTPVAESCDGLDNDCDGQVDEALGTQTCGQGACQRSVGACVNGVAPACTPGNPVAESCNGVDDDCDGAVDDGTCGPAVTCPAGQTVPANTTVALAASATSPAGRALSCAWSVVSRPATSSGAFTNGTNCNGGTLYDADVVGAHVLRFTTTDSIGLTSSCTVTITATSLGDLWVELTWNVPNDMDLHLLHPAGGNSHSALSWSTLYDAAWDNRTPSWDAAGVQDDPSLDRDDITGTGPENTRINMPSTTHLYTVGVHMFSWYALTPVTATVKVYCNGILKTTLSRTFSTDDQMWVVGTVNFAGAGAAGCFWTPDGYTLQVP